MEFTYPIAILSYNRPELLNLFLETLKKQTLIAPDANIHLFQDGPSSHPSSVESVRAAQNECVDVFLKSFPGGKVHYSEHNLGIGMNFDRAERYIFESIEADVGVFFEDDMMLSPYYISALNQLISFAMKESRIAYVAAYGNHTQTPELQARSARKVVQMHHKWGFALTRRQWLAQKEIVDGYLNIIKGKDYNKRDSVKIHEYFKSFGYDGPATSQDFCKDVASMILGTTKIMCNSCYGKYIGAEGTHFNKTLYDKMRFGDTVLWDCEPEVFEMPASDELDTWVESERKQARVEGEKPAPIVSAEKKTVAGSPEIAALPSSSALSIRMTPAEIALLTEHLKRSTSYLEFGAGGSTQLAIEHVRGTIVSVESDIAWIDKLKAHTKIKAAIESRQLRFMHVDIGPVGDWGVPRGETRIKSWKDYYSAPWISLDIPFDFVLIDGRFRIMSALMAFAYAPDEARIAIHDYSVRKHYFVLEKYFDTVENADTLVILKKRKIINHMSWASDVLKYFYDYG